MELKVGKFGTYFEHRGVALDNKEVLRMLKAYEKITNLVVGTPKTKEVKTSSIEKRKREERLNAPFMKKFKPSPELAAIVGIKPLTRSKVVSLCWDYVKKKNLQNPKNKRNIIADDKMYKILKKKEVTMFEFASLIGKHLS